MAVQRRTDVRTLLLGYEGINGEGLLLKILVGQRSQVQCSIEEKDDQCLSEIRDDFQITVTAHRR